MTVTRIKQCQKFVFYQFMRDSSQRYKAYQPEEGVLCFIRNYNRDILNNKIILPYIQIHACKFGYFVKSFSVQKPSQSSKPIPVFKKYLSVQNPFSVPNPFSVQNPFQYSTTLNLSHSRNSAFPKPQPFQNLSHSKTSAIP